MKCANCGGELVNGSVGRFAGDPRDPWKQEKVCFDCAEQEQIHNAAVARATEHQEPLDCDCAMCMAAEAAEVVNAAA